MNNSSVSPKGMKAQARIWAILLWPRRAAGVIVDAVGVAVRQVRPDRVTPSLGQSGWIPVVIHQCICWVW